jgi:hypothetical protein
MRILIVLLQNLLISKILITIINISIVYYFIEILIKKFLPKEINKFRILNFIMVCLFAISTFIIDKYQAFLFCIIASNCIQYSIFYMFYKKYKLYVFSFMNQFLFFSILSIYSILLYIHLELLLLFIYITILLAIYTAYLFYHIKLRYYKIYLLIIIPFILSSIFLFMYVFNYRIIENINLIIEIVYIFSLTGLTFAFKKRIKFLEDAKPVKEDLKVLINEYTLLKLKHVSEKENKTMDEYLEFLIETRLK